MNDNKKGLVMIKGIQNYDQISDYIDYLKRYLSNAPSSVRPQLIKQEVDFIDLQIDQFQEYSPGQLNSKLILLHFLHQRLKYEAESEEDIPEEMTFANQRKLNMKKESAPDKIRSYSELAIHLKSRALEEYHFPFDIASFHLTLSEIDDEYKHCLYSLFMIKLLTELRLYLMTHAEEEPFPTLDSDTFMEICWHKFIHDFMCDDAMLFMDMLILVQKHATLSDTYREERSAITAILHQPYKGAIEPQLRQVDALQEELRRITRPADDLIILLDDDLVQPHEEHFKITLTPSRIRKTPNLTTLIFDPNPGVGVYSQTRITFESSQIKKLADNKVIITLDKQYVSPIIDHSGNPKYQIKLHTTLPTPLETSDIQDAFDAFTQSQRVKVTEVKIEHDAYDRDTYRGEEVNVKNGFLIQNFEHTLDEDAKRYSQVEIDRLNRHDTPRFMFQNIEDKHGHLSDYYKHRYLPFTEYFDSKSSDQISSRDFMMEQLNALNDFKRMLSGHEAPSHDDTIFNRALSHIEGLLSPFDSQVNQELSSFVQLLKNLSSQSHPSGVTRNIAARQKAVTSLQDYLKRREADLASLHQNIFSVLQYLAPYYQDVADLCEQDHLTALLNSDNFESDFRVFQRKILELHNQIQGERIVDINRYLHSNLEHKHAMNVLKKLTETIDALLSAKTKHIANTVETALNYLDDIEAHSPTLRERTVLETIRNFFLYPLRLTFRKIGCFTESHFWFSDDERFVMKMKNQIAQTTTTSSKASNQFRFFMKPTPPTSPPSRTNYELVNSKPRAADDTFLLIDKEFHSGRKNAPGLV